MKYITSTALVFVLIFSFSNPAFAHHPTVILDYIGGVPVTPSGPILNIPYFPYTIDFDGRVIHEGEGNLNQILLWAEVNGDLIYGPEPLRGSGATSTHYFSIPWTVLEPGQYFVAVTAMHKEDYPHETKNKPCEAAPAIAAAYLKDNDGAKKDAMNLVAKETGKNGQLWAKEKCAENYELETIEFVLNIQN